jgi:hypothetical protein
MKKLLLVLLIVPLVSFGQNMVTLEEGTRVLENSPNNLNGYLDAFLDISLKLVIEIHKS